MLNEKIQQALNDQINAELQAYYTYLSMSAYFQDQNLRGFAAWVRHHSDEEMVHAMKIYDFVNDRRGRVKLQPIAQPKTTWESAQEVFEDALADGDTIYAVIRGSAKNNNGKGSTVYR